jgi:hypothetical protein
MRVADNSMLSFLYEDVDSLAPTLEFLFSNRMEAIGVKTVSSTRMVKAGKTLSEFDQRYLDDLRSRVEYWNGVTWESKPTMVSHDLITRK